MKKPKSIKINREWVIAIMVVVVVVLSFVVFDKLPNEITIGIFSYDIGNKSTTTTIPLFSPKFDIQSEQFYFEGSGVVIENINWYLPGEQNNISSAKLTALSYRDLINGIVFNIQGYLIDWAKTRIQEHKTIDIRGEIACHIDGLSDSANLSIPIAAQIKYRNNVGISRTTNYIGKISGINRFGENSTAELQIDQWNISDQELKKFIIDQTWSTAVATRISKRAEYVDISIFQENLSNGHCE